MCIGRNAWSRLLDILGEDCHYAPTHTTSTDKYGGLIGKYKDFDFWLDSAKELALGIL